MDTVTCHLLLPSVASNIPDAKETASCVLEDMKSKTPTLPTLTDPLNVIPETCSSQFITWKEYLRIDKEELRNGAKCNPPKIRSKILSFKEMISIAKAVGSHDSEVTSH